MFFSKPAAHAPGGPMSGMLFGIVF